MTEKCIYDLSKVEQGQIVKNYKELCKVLGVKPTTGKSKICQIKDIERYLCLKNAGGNKILIKYIYETPFAKIDARREGNNSVYRELISPGMIAILRKAKSKKFMCSKGYLLEQLGFVNSNYRKCRENISETSDYLNIPEENMRDFYAVNHTRVTKALKDNFEIFRRYSYCMVDDIHVICFKKDDELIYRAATEEEDFLILKCENIVKKKLGIKDDAEIYFKNLWNTYSLKVREELRKHNPAINYYYDGYYFKMDRDAIEEAYQMFIKDAGLTLKEIRAKINEESTKSAHNSAAKRQKLAHKRIDKREVAKAEGDNTVKLKKYAIDRDEMIIGKNFTKYNKKLANNLISSKANSIKIELDDEEYKKEESNVYIKNQDFLENRASQ